MNGYLYWAGFALIITIMLALDLGVFNRKAHTIKPKEALLTSLLWIGVSLAFNATIFYTQGMNKGLEFLTGYLIEKSLSVDNIFVFVVVFSYFHTDEKLQHKVLFWGILGALIMRGILIAVGSALIHEFEWIIYIFGAFLIYTAFRLATQSESGVHPEKNPVVNLFRKIMPITREYDGEKFFTRLDGKLVATPLVVVLLVVETTDLVFALDSIPAIFAITTDPFIVYTSNVFAILGLRALYFLLAGAMGTFRYLKIGLSLVLGFVGVKMIIAALNIKIPIAISLGVIAAILIVAITASLFANKRDAKAEALKLEQLGDEMKYTSEIFVENEEETKDKE
jgi:tellurite resistance protein TerC